MFNEKYPYGVLLIANFVGNMTKIFGLNLRWIVIWVQ